MFVFRDALLTVCAPAVAPVILAQSRFLSHSNELLPQGGEQGGRPGTSAPPEKRKRSMASSKGKPPAPTVSQPAGETRELATSAMRAVWPPKSACQLTDSTALTGQGRGFVGESLPAERRDNSQIAFASRPDVNLPPTPPRTTYQGWSRGVSPPRLLQALLVLRGSQACTGRPT